MTLIKLKLIPILLGFDENFHYACGNILSITFIISHANFHLPILINSCPHFFHRGSQLRLHINDTCIIITIYSG